jgi:hypothetical protein
MFDYNKDLLGVAIDGLNAHILSLGGSVSTETIGFDPYKSNVASTASSMNKPSHIEKYDPGFVTSEIDKIKQ